MARVQVSVLTSLLGSNSFFSKHISCHPQLAKTSSFAQYAIARVCIDTMSTHFLESHVRYLHYIVLFECASTRIVLHILSDPSRHKSWGFDTSAA